MPQSPDWKRYLEAGMQFTELRRSQARAVAADLVEQGQLARDQVANAVDEIIALSKRRSDAFTNSVRDEVSRQLGGLGLATQADLARLERKLNASIETGQRAAKRATGTAKRSAAKRTDKAAPAKKTTTKKKAD
jgi:polyhydroxyalkanoate synthesis regulator phasin